jgi:hypothetical protein
MEDFTSAVAAAKYASWWDEPHRTKLRSYGPLPGRRPDRERAPFWGPFPSTGCRLAGVPYATSSPATQG